MTTYSFWQLLEVYNRRQQRKKELAETIIRKQRKGDPVYDVVAELEALDTEIKNFERMSLISKTDIHF